MIDIHNMLAAIQYTPMTDLPFLTGSGTKWSKGVEFGGSTTDVLNQLFTLSITIGAMLAVFMFIWGGLQMITARDNAGNVGKGKTKMTNAVTGLIMLISTYSVLQVINPQITNLRLFKDIKPMVAGTQSSGSGSLTPQEVKKLQKDYTQKLHESTQKFERQFCTTGLISTHQCYLDADLCKTANGGNCHETFDGNKMDQVADGGWYLNIPGFSTIARYSNADACQQALEKLDGSLSNQHPLCEQNPPN